MSVEPDCRVGHGAIDIQIELFSLFIRGYFEMLSIPGDAAPFELAGFAWIVLIEGAFDPPIVRQVQLPPIAIIKIALRIGNVGAEISRRPLGLLCVRT